MQRHAAVSAPPNADATAQNAAARHHEKLAGLRRAPPYAEVCHIISTEMRQIISKTTVRVDAFQEGAVARIYLFLSRMDVPLAR